MITLSIEKRDPAIKNEILRAEDKIPAVFYGGGEESTAIVMTYGEFIRVYREAGESTVIELAGDDIKLQALVQDYQQDPVTDKVTHVDFKIIEAGKSIEVSVPIEFIDESPAVEQNIGTLTKILHELEVEVLPKDLPHSIEVSLENLKEVDDQISIRDVKVPTGVELLHEDEQTVAIIAAIREEEEEEEESGEIDFDSIEVEKKGKEDEEGGDSEE